MQGDSGCPFCDVAPSRIVASNAEAVAVLDAFPVSRGHTLVVPRRHVPSWWGTTAAQRAAVDALVLQCKALLDDRYRPHGYNVGFNDGAVAGQTIFHAHVHLIPRYPGDATDPRGGVRHVIPGRGNYLRAGPAQQWQPAHPLVALAQRDETSATPSPSALQEASSRTAASAAAQAEAASPAEAAASATEQADLVQRVLAVLNEGRRSATYKPALLLALTELAVERSQPAAPLTLPLADVADRVMELYWPQTRPYPALDAPALRQGPGRSRLRITTALLQLRAKSGAGPGTPLGRVRGGFPVAYQRCRRAVERALAKQPVPRLQRPGSASGADGYPRFLFDDSRYQAERGALDPRPVITLYPGVAEALARNAALIRIAAHDVWVDGVAGFNGLQLEGADLSDFMFGAERSSLAPVAEGLRDLGIRDCFWCRRALGRNVEVDHVIPWSHYANDDLSNLVLTDRGCNNDKRDRLVTADLASRWLARDAASVASLAESLRWPNEPRRARAVARSSYRYLAAGMPVWRGRRDVVLFDESQRASVLRSLDRADSPQG